MEILNELRDKVANKLLNILINFVATKEYSRMLNVMVGLGIEQLENRKPVNYELEEQRLKARGLIPEGK